MMASRAGLFSSTNFLCACCDSDINCCLFKVENLGVVLVNLSVNALLLTEWSFWFFDKVCVRLC